MNTFVSVAGAVAATACPAGTTTNGLVGQAACVPSIVVYTSGSDVDTWNPIFPAFIDGSWPSTVCVPTPAVGLGAAWTNPHKASSFGTGAHPWQGGAGFTANWINAWGNLSSTGAGGSGHSWTKYSTPVTGNGSFVLNLLADNCSWIYLDGVLVGFQDASLSPRTYPVTLSGSHTLEFIIFDGGGLAGGEYRLETNTGAVVFPDTDDDGLTDPQEHLYGTDLNNPDTDNDGVSDGDEVAAGTNPMSPAIVPTTTTVSFGAGPFTYTGSAFTATSTVTPAAAGAATIAYTGDCTNAGSTCTAVATFAATSAYAGSSASANITIAKAPSTTVVSGGGAFLYDGSGHPLTATVTGAGGLSASVPVAGCVASPTNVADECTGTATYAGDANHTGSIDSANITIGYASSTTVVSGGGTFVYDGSGHPLTATVTGAGGLSASVPVAGCVASPTNVADSCTGTATYAGDANHSGSSDSASVTITPASSTTVVSGGGTFVYDGSGHPLTATVTGAGGLSASVPVAGCVASPTNVADSCTGTATYAGDANHTGSSASATVTITKAPTTTSVSFGAGPFVYTGSAFTATSSVSPAAAGTATIAYSGDCTNGGVSCAATATYAESANYLGSSASASITITYAFCGFNQPLLVPVQEFKAGSTIPVKFCFKDASGATVSSVTGTVEAYVNGVLMGTVAFRFSDGHYQANVQTKDGKTNWPTGTLEFRVKPNDGTTHSTNALSTAGVKGGLKLK